MQNQDDLPYLLAMLQNNLKLLSALTAKFDQRESHMRSAFDKSMASLRDEVTQLHQRVDYIVHSANERITEEARAAMAPVTAGYSQAVSTVSKQLHGASKTVWTWYGGLAILAVLVFAVGWGVLGYFRHELASAKEGYERYDNAASIAQAFYASDAVICGGRICSNDDPNGQRAGDKRQYRQAKPRPGQ
jgi:hypothetical protein